MTGLLRSLLLSALIAMPLPAAAAQAEDVGDQLVRETRLLAEQGDPEAQFSLGLLLDTGGQVAHDPAKAASWFARAAEQGLAGACLYLGMKYEFGSGVRQDREQAIHWYRQAALQGWGQAAYMLGRLYLSPAGEEPARDKTIKGCAWLCIAKEQGVPGAADALQQNCRPLDPATRQVIRTRCRELDEQISKTRDQTSAGQCPGWSGPSSSWASSSTSTSRTGSMSAASAILPRS